jgi:hypothetical protein
MTIGLPRPAARMRPFRVAVVFLIVIFFAVAVIFLFVFFLVWLFSKEDVGSSRRAIRGICGEAP